jgi:hypothetical protein
VSFHLPDDLKAGRTYSGTWPLHDLHYFVRLIIAEAKQPSSGGKPR